MFTWRVKSWLLKAINAGFGISKDHVFVGLALQI